MEWFCSFAKFSQYFKNQSNYFSFLALHLYRSFLIWLYGLLVKPLETFVDTFLKNEPSDTQWVHFYSLTTCTYISNFGIEMFSFDSEDTYLCPLTNCFDLFVKNEYDLFLNHAVKQPNYDAEFEQIPEIMETLLVVRNDDKYICRTFPVLHCVPNHKKELCVIPEKSNIEFVIIEYKHPKMFDKIELKIPEGFYLVDNEILSPAFIQRMLELQRSFYVFDHDYEVMFIDDDLECKKIHFNNFVKLDKNTYTICSSSTETLLTDNDQNGSQEEQDATESEKKEDEGEKEDEDDQIVQTVEVTPWISKTFIFACCIFMGSVLPLAQMLNNQCKFI